ncbi:hypothetical protein SLA_6118 [Streptomyces laurentii]|uniref:Uncharacterized protein n=2 Tax=Streptomyces laurentii TaxID=39478 RepID=A0A160P5F0_STRLU|nr:hypothetical protein SLA_6118 [Streptomyces laurentii]
MGLLSWLRGSRGGATTSEAAAPRSGPAPDTTDAATPAAPEAREDRFDVAELPPIQRVLEAPSLVTDPSGFESGLSTRRPTALTSSLGHLVSADAPSGVAGGVTAPVQRSVVDFPVRALPAPSLRETATGAHPDRARDGDVIPEPDAGPVVSRALAGTDAAPTVVQPVAPRPKRPEATAAGRPAVQRVTPPAAPEPEPEAESVADQPTEPEQVSAPGEESHTEPDAPVRPLVGDRAPLDAPEPTSPSPGVQRSPGTPTPAPTPPPPATPRRAPGLGAPLPELPPTAQRKAAATASTTPTTPDSTHMETPTAVREEPASLPDAAPLPPPEPAPEPVAPLLADRPLQLRTVAEEQAAPGVPVPPAVQPVRWEPAPAPAPVQRATGAPARAAATTQRQQQRPTSAAEPVVARSVSPAALNSPPPPRAPRDAGDVAVAAGIAQRMSDGSVVFLPPPPPVQRAVSPASGPFVQRETVTEEPPPPDPAPEPTTAAPEPAPEPEPGPEASAPPGAPATGAPGAAGTPGAPGTPAVTDEFVRALYPPLARLLKADLRLDRERAGRLLDTRP